MADRSPTAVRIDAPGRLHFGMFGFGHTAQRQFGGVGLTIQPDTNSISDSSSAPSHSPPRCSVHIGFQPAAKLSASGDLPDRCLDCARRFAQAAGIAEPPCCIVAAAPPQHSGLGVGTALGLAVAAGLQAMYATSLSPQQLAASVGRGRRSAVGVHGFFHGGLIVEAGKLPGEAISPLSARVELPESWRFVLIRPLQPGGLSGQEEIDAFERLPATPAALTQQACAEVLLHLLPAAQGGDFSAFARSLHRFGQLAGGMFAPRQHGVYGTPAAAEIAKRLLADGAPCVVQSSWGPTLAVPAPDAASAVALASHASTWFSDVELQIARPANQGFQCRVE